MRINTNISAINSYNQLNQTNKSMEESLQKLSSGKRINRAADDAAGLAISEKMKSQMNGLAQAQRNAQDGISMIQTAEGALKETQAMLQRMRELSVQAANDSNTTQDRKEIQKEIDELTSQITDISSQTKFNNKQLLDGTATGVKFHVGANKGETMSLSINDMSATAGGLGVTGISVTTQAGAESAINTLDTAISNVSAERAKLGAKQNRLEHSINNLSTSEENLTAANSRIRDVDMAKEMMNMSKQKILRQAGTAMLAQANQKPQGVLQLLG
ncbi:flagellin [Sporohalobacter salinus]|uniref:flagellin N-terminal helical domain-containing protein n=1 Tax=Sporohalobacter salinus TaxID=1494606 RepID=UPI001960AB46|nr:flagellin [Sporohalobacter salinus]MBM7623035.1 flagellin [Sporohalobacter salinus]